MPAKKPAAPLDKWFTLELIAQGPESTVKVDGKVTGRVTDATYAKGHLLLHVCKELAAK